MQMQTEKEKVESGSPLRAKILIVDDDPELRMALKLRLRANHYDTVSASDGYSAIALAQKERPNLIILDLGLPAGNGFVVLKRLQESDTLSHSPVIVLTARDPQGNELRSLDSGATAFFQKPADNNELLQVIRASLRSASAWGATLPS
jgi:DNA-binding response OmpR family regulator